MSIRKFALFPALLLAVLAAALFVACGGDSGGSSSGSSGSTGSDETYVAQICGAQLKFTKALEDATKDMTPADLSSPDAMVKLFTGPFNDYLSALGRANPPKDVKPFHDEMVKTFKAAQEQMKTNPNALNDLNPPAPPQNVTDRLDKVAAANKDCQAADFAFGD